ncbi:MAG: DUF3034 family protein [Alphaproteobacteria bacterium]|nr:DUF3034 family protein [Alphaproteobacteria bacterium]
MAQTAGMSDRLLLTGGVSEVEGAAGGGLTPWALIGGYGTRDQLGASGYYTHVDTDDYSLESFGALLAVNDRVEFSISQQRFNLQDVGASLGLGSNYKIDVTTYGAKVRVLGDAILEQDSWIPQVAVGVLYKDNNRDTLVKSLGADHSDGADFYVSATKLLLAHSLLLNATARLTRANQFGILGQSGDYKPEFEGSAAYLLTRKIAVGAEIRTKPDNLAGLKEDTAYDAFVAYAPTKNLAVTLAYADLGNIVVGDQRGLYISLQAGF